VPTARQAAARQRREHTARRIAAHRGFRPSQPRDQIGHWVTPPSMREHPCPHRCCQNRQIHPANLPVKLDRQYLRGLSGRELERELDQYGRYSDIREKGFFQVIGELNRREESGRKAAASKERARRRRQDAEQEYRDEVYRQWLAAEAATNGYMLNKAGQQAGIDERSLFVGPESRVRKYASPELFEWFESHPRPTRASWFGSATARRAHLAGRRIG
jgi:hypothetical protein